MVARWLLNRFTITFGAIAIAIGLWNVYVSTNSSGLIAGRVVGPDNGPVEGAIVVLLERTLLVTRPKDNTTTDAEGRFRFEDQDLYRLYIEVKKPGVGEADAREFRLYFKGQELVINEPIRLVAEMQP